MPACDARVRSAAAGALAFLTRLPVDRGRTFGGRRLAEAAVLFPLVGAALGAAVGGAAAALATLVPPLLAATAAVALELALTGALHVDGLADTFDGLAGRDAERRLAIMRDHSLGTYGGSALALDLLARVAALASLTDEGVLLPAVAAFAISRAAPLPLAAALPYARPGEGTGRLLTESTTARHAVAGIVLAAAVAAAAVGFRAAAMLVCLGVVVAATGLYARSRLGGVTGDVMGAAIELTATLALAGAIAQT
jgi:adenosylcobinamide-GDP ribazoletransferase